MNLIAGTNIVDPGSVPKPVTPVPAAQPSTAVSQPPLLNLIRPSSRDRWTTTLLSYYTPERVETTMRSALSGNLVAQWMMFDLMEQTWPRLSKNLNELKGGAIGLNRIVRPFADKDEKPSDEAVRRAKIVDKLLRTMRPNLKRNERDLDGTIYDVLDAVGKGIALQQVIWEQRNVRIGTNISLLWCPRATQWVHQRFYGYPGTDMPDELMLNAREVAMTNPDFAQGGNGLWLPILEDEFIVSIIQQKSGHPVSSAMFRVLATFWSFSTFTWDWWLNFAQIFGAPIRWATYDPATSTQDTINFIQQMLAQMGSMGYALFPAGTTLDLKEATKSGQDNPQKMLLDACDLICDLVVFWESMTSQHGGPVGNKSGGTLAAAAVGQDKRTERIQSVANAAAKILNESLIRAICRLNFNDDEECPQLVIVTKANKDLVSEATRYQIILQTPGVKISKQQYYEDNELTMPDDDDDVIEGQAVPKPGFGGSAGVPPAGGKNPEEEAAMAHAHSHTHDGLVNRVLENLTGVSARWLLPVKPIFRELIAKARNANVTDAELVVAIAKARAHMPELFHKLDTASLATAMENAMGTALVNGAITGHLARHSPLITRHSP